jgi:hypothetical protein
MLHQVHDWQCCVGSESRSSGAPSCWSSAVTAHNGAIAGCARSLSISRRTFNDWIRPSSWSASEVPVPVSRAGIPCLLCTGAMSRGRPNLLHGAFTKRACATCSVPMPVAE